MQFKHLVDSNKYLISADDKMINLFGDEAILLCMTLKWLKSVTTFKSTSIHMIKYLHLK